MIGALIWVVLISGIIAVLLSPTKAWAWSASVLTVVIYLGLQTMAGWTWRQVAILIVVLIGAGVVIEWRRVRK